MAINGFNYRPEIDGLRALAVIPVILFHAGFHLYGRMLQLNAQVVFFRPRYKLSADPMRAAMLGKYDELKIEKVRAKEYVDGRIDHLADSPHLTVFNERDALLHLGCGDTNCFNGHTADLKPLYRDTNHLTNYGARLVFQQLTSSLKQQMSADRVHSSTEALSKNHDKQSAI